MLLNTVLIMPKFHYCDLCDQVLCKKSRRLGLRPDFEEKKVGVKVCDFLLLKVWSQTWSYSVDQVAVMESGHIIFDISLAQFGALWMKEVLSLFRAKCLPTLLYGVTITKSAVMWSDR